MTAYDPLPTVTIGGITYTSDTINAIQTTSGRNTVDEQPRAGYATISLIDVNGTYPTITLNQAVRVTVKDSTGVTDEPVFYGYVTDIQRTIQAHGVTGMAVQIDVTVAGPISRLARILTAASYPKEFDGDRVEQILLDYEATAWNEVNPLTTWATIDPALTWATYDPAFVGNIDTPGSYEITEYNGNPVSAISHLNQVASSALGVLWESSDGLVNYSDAASRLTKVANDGFLQIDSQYLSGIGLSAKSSLGNLINDFRVTYKNSQIEVGTDPVSIATWGQFVGQKDTLLENKADAEDMVQLYLTTRAYPRNSLQTVTIPLHNDQLPDGLRDALIAISIGSPITIPDIPQPIYDGPFFGFVEGVSYTMARKAAAVTLYISEYALSQIEQAWQQVDDAELWNTISATLTWENATVVG